LIKKLSLLINDEQKRKIMGESLLKKILVGIEFLKILERNGIR